MGRRTGATPLTPERIYEAGLAIIDASGLDGFSMRKLGAALGVDPMAVYHHVPNKEALFHGIVREVFAGMRTPTPSAPWRLQVSNWAHSYRAIVEAHPNLILKIVTSPDAVAVASSEANEALLRALSLSGLAPEDVGRAADIVVDFVNGTALARASAEVNADEALTEELDQVFAFGLSVVLDGLEARAARERA